MNNYYYDPQVEAYRLAERRVKAKLGFFWHLASYILVNGFLITIYLITSWDNNGLYYPWFVWPLLGWGIGLVFNFLAVFVFPDTPASRQRMIEKEMQTLKMSDYPVVSGQPTVAYPPYQPGPISNPVNGPAETPVSSNKTPVG